MNFNPSDEVESAIKGAKLRFATDTEETEEGENGSQGENNNNNNQGGSEEIG